MEKNYDPDNSAEAWVLSNPPVILLDMHLAALKVFDKVGIKNIFRKSKELTAFLYNGLLLVDPEEFFFKISVSLYLMLFNSTSAFPYVSPIGRCV